MRRLSESAKTAATVGFLFDMPADFDTDAEALPLVKSEAIHLLELVQMTSDSSSLIVSLFFSKNPSVYTDAAVAYELTETRMDQPEYTMVTAHTSYHTPPA